MILRSRRGTPSVLQLAFLAATAAMACFSCLAAAFATRARTGRSLSLAASAGVRAGSISAFSNGRSAASTRLFASANSIDVDADAPVPITLLSGFLGAGKTTTLQHLLENRDGLRIGVIVNDMASVNIDASLVKDTEGKGKGNNKSKSNKPGEETSIVELQNGCACCSLADELLTTVDNLLESRNNNNNNNDGAFDALVVELSGVAEPIAIQQNWKAAKANGHPVTRKADMKRVVTLVDSSTFGTDWMTWDVAGERDGWTEQGDTCAVQRKVPELLAEQVEAADVLLLNKIDLAGPDQVEVAAALAKSINKKAVVEEIAFGRVASPKQIVREEASETTKEEAPSQSGCCSNPSCPSNLAKKKQQEEEEAKQPRATVSTDDLGIVSFVYKADRPFDAPKLMGLLNTWPIPVKEDLGGLEHFSPESAAADGGEDVGRTSPFFGVLRSKGFCWMAPTNWATDGTGDPWRHDSAMYWSHAGKHFGISVAGKWWGTLVEEEMKEYFANDREEYNRIRTEEFVTEEWGDRRQELVFIGANIDRGQITEALDACLLNEKGMKRYAKGAESYQRESGKSLVVP
ncbi:unnamed protein product [Pseudo-nitzschia multistriata]|uniref:CobW C-terminal domain-containing protein n=1 Tax=Pseudo-nitzschia multistriata TaxID=183589 RepID=A0A448ZF23_9STRA|nr:unnamed protein product [Pseudo-nitzschia multistriata]